MLRERRHTDKTAPAEKRNDYAIAEEIVHTMVHRDTYLNARDFFDPTPEQQNVVLIDSATLQKAQRMITGCEACSEGAECRSRMATSAEGAEHSECWCTKTLYD
jgi:hypothetical protein